MSNYYFPGGCNVVSAPTCNDCPTKVLGRVRSMFLQRSSYAFTDISNPLEWENAICNQNVYVFPKTNGSMTMSEQLTAGFGDREEDLMNYEYVLNIKEPNFPANQAFWNTIKRANIFYVGWRTQSSIYVSSAVATIIPKFDIVDDIKQATYWNIILKFVQEDLPVPQTIPNTIFAQCVSC